MLPSYATLRQARKHKTLRMVIDEGEDVRTRSGNEPGWLFAI